MQTDGFRLSGWMELWRWFAGSPEGEWSSPGRLFQAGGADPMPQLPGPEVSLDGPRASRAGGAAWPARRVREDVGLGPAFGA